MTDRYPPVNPRCPHFLHGADYNPDQWAATPEVWDDDMRLMKLARCNAMSVGIFSWAQLEPTEGTFTFDWLDRIMDMLADNDAFAVLATPSAAHPAWMSQKYPEVLRTGADRVRTRHGGRVNYCLTSPVYREKCRIIAGKLAERYADHPALLIWHVHNEYGGECHCELCQEAFRDWLRRRYESLDELNERWWTAFWGHTYSDWSQIESGEWSVQPLVLDWKRFTTDQTIACFTNEADVLREATPDVPVTTNTYSFFVNYDGRKWADVLDVIAWDDYPQLHDRGAADMDVAVDVSFHGDYYRSLKDGQPYLLMETTPSTANWMPVSKLKRPGVHRLVALHHVAHGGESVQYFQWRKSRACAEKLHGAVVDHVGHEDTRTLHDVAEVGEILGKLDDVLGTTVPAEAAVIYDTQNHWAIDASAGPRAEKRDYAPTCLAHYRPLWERGVCCDVIDMEQDFSRYKLLIAPMLYMVREGVAERIEQFVRGGGVFAATYWSGIVDECDRCRLGGFPGPLRDLLGVWAEELDVLYDDETVRISAIEPNDAGLGGDYEARCFCDLIHATSAETLAVYAGEFYAGRPAVTVNAVGDGRAFYVASRNDRRFLDDLYGRLVEDLSLRRAMDADLPDGVTAQLRTDGEREFLFLLNFLGESRRVPLDGGMTDLITGERRAGHVELGPHGSTVLERE